MTGTTEEKGIVHIILIIRFISNKLNTDTNYLRLKISASSSYLLLNRNLVNVAHWS